MTESAWQKSDDPDAMLEAIGDDLSVRKTRLLACAFCRRVLAKIPDVRAGKALAVNEDFADKSATAAQLAKAYAIAWEIYEVAMTAEEGPEEPFADAVQLACSEKLMSDDLAEIAEAARLEDYYDEPTEQEEVFTERERLAQVKILRDFFDDRFRRVIIAKEWLTREVKSLAKRIYDEQAFDQMPVLADLLEEAGCTERDLLQHCRKTKKHARGCWVLDALLSRK